MATSFENPMFYAPTAVAYHSVYASSGNPSTQKAKAPTLPKSSIRFYIFCIGWLWRNRTWGDSRQKYKAMNREWQKKGSKA